MWSRLKTYSRFACEAWQSCVLVLEGDVNWNYGATDGDRGSCWRLHRWNGITSREPHSGSLYRYRDWFCRVSVLFLEAVRRGRGHAQAPSRRRVRLGR